MRPVDDQTVREPITRVRTPRAYKICDGLTEAVVYFMVVFTPWAFGTTQHWSTWTMNISGYLLGGLLMTKWIIRWRTGYGPSRWGEGEEVRGRAEEWVRGGDGEERGQKSEVRSERPEGGGQRGEGGGLLISRGLTIALASLTVVMLLYCLISALNARATFYPEVKSFEYRDYIGWLPHSYDSASTWQAFWSYLGLACFFWSARDWLLGKTSRERGSRGARGESRGARVEGREEPESPSSLYHPLSAHVLIPTRLRRLLWVLCINGGLLALEGILQRLDGTNKLLWLVVPRFNNTADAQFGPYAYRSNAAAYINLVWPVCLGFWLALRKTTLRRRVESQRVGGGNYALLLPCAVIMAASPIFSTSRGGALVAILQILITTVILFFATRRERIWIRAGALSLSLFILGLTAYLGWRQLQERLENVFVDNLSNRTEIYENASQLATDFPLLGTGPGAFGSAYFLYKKPDQAWAAYLHDDWLETRVTFGWIGFSLALLMLSIVLVRWFLPGGIRAPWELVTLIWLALAGCLLHAKFDFPFQVYSILFLFLLLCSVLFCVSRKA